eukprot:12402701-Karenia_brevis.AAC.1
MVPAQGYGILYLKRSPMGQGALVRLCHIDLNNEDQQADVEVFFQHHSDWPPVVFKFEVGTAVTDLSVPDLDDAEDVSIITN